MFIWNSVNLYNETSCTALLRIFGFQMESCCTARSNRQSFDKVWSKLGQEMRNYDKKFNFRDLLWLLTFEIGTWFKVTAHPLPTIISLWRISHKGFEKEIMLSREGFFNAVFWPLTLKECSRSLHTCFT